MNSNLKTQLPADTLQETNKNLGETIIASEKKLNDATQLLIKVLHRHEGGLLPDRILYLEIKKFLYGE